MPPLGVGGFGSMYCSSIYSAFLSIINKVLMLQYVIPMPIPATSGVRNSKTGRNFRQHWD